MVGHTHEDVDQLFSKIGFFLNKHKIRTLEGRQNIYTMYIIIVHD